MLVPTGSIEQHGPHLPLNTDSYLCTAVVEAAASTAGDPVLVAPTLCFGSSEHHMRFPGTLTLTAETYLRAVQEVCRSLARHGFARLVVVNGHGGNTALNAVAVQQLGFELDVHVLSVDYFALARDAISAIRESPPGGMGHACEFETSLMLHLRPDSVRSELAVREIVEPRYRAERFDLVAGGPVSAHWKTHELSRSGVMGAPDLASADKGRELFDACVDALAALIADVRARPLSPDGGHGSSADRAG